MKILELFKSKESPKKNKPLHSQSKGFLAFISIVFPILMYYVFKEDEFGERFFLKLVILLFPLSYSAAEYFILFHKNWESNWKPLTLLQRMPYLILNIFFLIFSAVSIFSIIVLSLAEWDDQTLENSIILPSLFVSPTYLLSTSCSFTPELISFTDSITTAFLDLLILSSSMVSLLLWYRESEHYVYISATSSLFILARSLKEHFFPSSEYPESTVTWRTFVLIVICLTNVLLYSWVGLNIFMPSIAKALLESSS
ncbi:DUF2463 domain-containing protein [Encephalitozoon hellem]|uniref:DUF2463 domain-containing protein n=1 Tax=Encephalitozoon hellem TaxID=27973 RepID=A0A9Q9CDI9_ENCHE|nr:DUF2463 domain-containing protein [Encephalitozoon hellem]